jgi:hypothetical protein
MAEKPILNYFPQKAHRGRWTFTAHVLVAIILPCVVFGVLSVASETIIGTHPELFSSSSIEVAGAFILGLAAVGVCIMGAWRFWNRAWVFVLPLMILAETFYKYSPVVSAILWLWETGGKY